MSHWEHLDRLYEEAFEYATNWEDYDEPLRDMMTALADEPDQYA